VTKVWRNSGVRNAEGEEAQGCKNALGIYGWQNGQDAYEKRERGGGDIRRGDAS